MQSTRVGDDMMSVRVVCRLRSSPKLYYFSSDRVLFFLVCCLGCSSVTFHRSKCLLSHVSSRFAFCLIIVSLRFGFQTGEADLVHAQ